MKRSSILAAICLLLLIVGCVPKQPITQPKGYFGPTLSLPELVNQINANNQRIPTLYANTKYEAVIRDPETNKVTTVYDTDGTIQYRAPGEFRMRLNKTLKGNVLDVGMNRERYWLVMPEGPEQMWWGHVDRLRRAGQSEIPIRPEDLLNVLAVSTMNTDLLATPAPIVRFNNDADAYMLVWVSPSAGQFIATREIWYDRKTLAPTMVLLFDQNGRIVLRAYLSKHRPVDGPENPPRIAGRYEIFFPENQSHLILELERAQLTRNNAPNDLSFRFPPKDIVPKVKQVDADVQK